LSGFDYLQDSIHFKYVNQLLSLSRPRFWPYLAGPYIIGVAAAYSASWSALQVISILIGLIFFLWPANFYLYTVNDIHDYETDKHNPKKQHYEQLLKPSQHARLNLLLAYIIAITLGGSLFFLDIKTQTSLFAFFFLAHFYSTPPIRAKARPFVDMIFNALYVMPALVGFYIAGGGSLNTNWQVVAAAIVWCMAMHAYSAVPDISSDLKAKVPTVATTLGYRGTLLVCIGLYLVSGILAISSLGLFAIISTAIYVTLMLMSLLFPKQLFRYYSYFPYINLVLGFALFVVTVVLHR
jgi:lycopene elongase/hydratase (dihydrobisanhydrobacterioruberin-forming)